MNKCLKIVGCFLLLDFFLLTSLWGQINVAHQKGIVSGEVWKDTDGNVINAHGGVSSSTMGNTTGLESTGLLPVLQHRWE